MAVTLYHRTSIAEARRILKKGFSDTDWDFGLRDAKSGEELVVTGVWLADRPLQDDEGPPGDALLEVTVQLTDAQLRGFELKGLLGDARLWVIPAERLNAHGQARLIRVDPRSSWGFHQVGDEEPGGEDLTDPRD